MRKSRLKKNECERKKKHPRTHKNKTKKWINHQFHSMVINIFRILLKKYNKWIGGQSVSKDGNEAELNWIETIKKWANEQNRVMMIFAFTIHVQSVDSSIENSMMIYLRTLFDPMKWTISFPVTFFLLPWTFSSFRTAWVF